MEIMKFETSVAAPSQLERLSRVMDNLPNIVDWCVDYFSHHFLLSVKGSIKALDVINALEDQGINAIQLYEE
ncbi:MAG: hypothetical protein EAS52_00495 [Parapedobacter sp.]|nr:MAG: hypothetical protein EAS52_00495 [Parapedobacter sp.]